MEAPTPSLVPNASPSGDDGHDLDPIEIRVLGVLIEKAFVTPDAYPLSINAIVSGSNQLTARDPVMSISEGQAQAAIDSLMARKLVSRRDQAGARVSKYEHLVRVRHSLPPAEQAVLATLMLRGAQTAGEIRQRCERLYRFDDIPAVEAVLEHLAEKYPPMVASLPRAPGTKEVRHAHLLGGTALFEEMAGSSGGAVSTSSGRGRLAELEDEIGRLRGELDALRREFDAFRQQFN
ncbi:MAG: YceH family protein [Thauera sp.]|nr:YceH family protein [Thauera sp.]